MCGIVNLVEGRFDIGIPAISKHISNIFELISHEDAVKKAEFEYDFFNRTRLTSSDFVKQLKSFQEEGLFAGAKDE